MFVPTCVVLLPWTNKYENCIYQQQLSILEKRHFKEKQTLNMTPQSDRNDTLRISIKHGNVLCTINNTIYNPM